MMTLWKVRWTVVLLTWEWRETEPVLRRGSPRNVGAFEVEK